MTIRRAIPNLLVDDLAASARLLQRLPRLRRRDGRGGLHDVRLAEQPHGADHGRRQDNPGLDRGVIEAQVSVEVEDVDALHAEAVRRGLEIVYPLTNEPWGIRRFFVRDPDGTVINVAQHLSS